MADPVVGSVLGGKYLVEGVLGQGGMGIVVAARHIELDQRVAIKCLLAHAQTVPEIVERFTREARAAAKIHGEHVARVIDVGRFDDGTPFMVMEHLKGRDLADELAARGPLSITDAVRYLLETCEALAQAHALRIVHRDLKPSNLFLAEQPGRRAIVKVLDFGISKVIDPSGGALTKTASVMGTPYYMSPEQLLSSKSVDERSDVWALGIIFYELLFGRPPFMAETAPEVVAQVLQNAPAPISTVRQDVPQGVGDIIERCMRSKVAERFANVAELAQALAPFAAPEDRGSAQAIARVLGVSETAALAAPDPAPAMAAHAPTVSARRSSPPSTGGMAPAGTAHNLSLSSADVARSGRRPLGAILAGVGVLGAVAIAGVVALRRPAPLPAAADNALVAPAAAGPPTAAPAPVGLVPVDPTTLVAPAAGAPAATFVAAPSPATPALPAARGLAKHAAPAPAASSHSTAAPAPLPPTPAPAAPAPAAAPPSNPLDMHIK